MIENDEQLAVTKKLADSFRHGRDDLIRKRGAEGSDRILEATIASLEGQLLRFHEEIREYEARVLSR
jgi:hypothetical protein